MRYVFSFLALAPLFCLGQQSTYEDSITNFVKKYVAAHEVVRGADKEKFRFFPINKNLKAVAVFELKEGSPWFLMPTSGALKSEYRVFGLLSFSVNDTTVKLNIYQSRQLLGLPEYADYLFIPFTDKTTGFDTYGGGRYIDLRMTDIKSNSFVIDFNKAYNPYCAYAAGYNCPIPPKENDLPVTISAGEKNYAGH